MRTTKSSRRRLNEMVMETVEDLMINKEVRDEIE